MKFALEAERGWINECPDKLLDTLVSLAALEGADPEDFRLRLAKAAGATKAHFHGTEKSEFQLLEDAAVEAKGLYDTAMTVAISEISNLISDHFSKVNVEDYRKQAGVKNGG